MASNRSIIRPLPALPMDEIAQEASAWVHERLAGASDPAAIVTTATKLIEEQSKPFERARKRRDEIALSIREYGPDATEQTPVRLRNVRLAEAAGISRPRLQTLRNGWFPSNGPVPLIPNARRELPKAAKRAAMHECRIETARSARDAAIVQLIEAGWKNVAIAKLMGRDPSRAAHLRKAARDAQIAS